MPAFKAAKEGQAALFPAVVDNRSGPADKQETVTDRIAVAFLPGTRPASFAGKALSAVPHALRLSIIVTVLLGESLILLPSMQADEGMWLFNDPPRSSSRRSTTST